MGFSAAKIYSRRFQQRGAPSNRIDRDLRVWEAERFVESADLSKYDLSGLKPVRFEFEAKSAQLNMRVPKALLETVKKRAATRGIPYTRFIREAVESALTLPER